MDVQIRYTYLLLETCWIGCLRAHTHVTRVDGGQLLCEEWKED